MFASCTCIHAANLVLQNAVERIFVGNRYGDIPRGLFLVRGENVVLLGEIVSRAASLSSQRVADASLLRIHARQDLDVEDEPHPAAVPLPPQALPQLLEAHKADVAVRKTSDARKAEVLRREKGFCPEGAEGDTY